MLPAVACCCDVIASAAGVPLLLLLLSAVPVLPQLQDDKLVPLQGRWMVSE
jgi:hypothetical protein